MKSLKNKIFAGALALTSLGIFGMENLSAQNTDPLKIKIDTIYMGQLIHAKGYLNNKRVAFVGCSFYKDNHYTQRNINSENPKQERFTIDYNTGFIDYEIYYTSPDYITIAEFKNLTIEQIDQDTAFAERTKRIINACGSAENLREMVKEIYKENGEIKIPNIKQ